MYCLWLTTFLLVPAVVFSQGYLCPESSGGATTCQVLPNHCRNDTTCHVPGERCCDNGCHGPTCRPVVPRMCPVGEGLNTTDGPRTCSHSQPCPAGFYCHVDEVNRQGACCRNHTLTGCSSLLCGRDQLCYLHHVGVCADPPCAKRPTCFTHPCKNLMCQPGEKCRLVKNAGAPYPVKASCQLVTKPSGAGIPTGSFVILTMVPVVGAFLATL